MVHNQVIPQPYQRADTHINVQVDEEQTGISLGPKFPRISVIIPHYNDLDSLCQCLDRLTRQTLSLDPVEIIVVDNNSTIGIEAVRAAVNDIFNAQANQHAIVIQAQEQGAAMARNAGVSMARGPILAFIDSDCRPAPDWLEKGYQAMASSDIDIIGGRVCTVPHQQNHPSAVEAFELVFAFQNEVYVREVGFSVTANMFVKRDVFHQVGPFRTGLSEDKDWGQRAGAMGYTIDYQDDVIIDHPARSNWRDLKHKWRRLTHEEYILRQAKGLGQLNWLIYTVLIFCSPFIHLIKVLKFKEFGPISKLKAVLILFRIRFYRFREALSLSRKSRVSF